MWAAGCWWRGGGAEWGRLQSAPPGQKTVRPDEVNIPILGFPMTLSPASNHLLLADGFIKSTSQSFSDKFLRWTGDVTPGAASWETYWYLGTATIPAKWVKSGDATLASQDLSPLFSRHRSFMVTVKTAKPNRAVPPPWVP